MADVLLAMGLAGRKRFKTVDGFVDGKVEGYVNNQVGDPVLLKLDGGRCLPWQSVVSYQDAPLVGHRVAVTKEMLEDNPGIGDVIRGG